MLSLLTVSGARPDLIAATKLSMTLAWPRVSSGRAAATSIGLGQLGPGAVARGAATLPMETFLNRSGG